MVALLILMSVFIIIIGTVSIIMAADEKKSELIIGIWESTKIIDGKSMTVIYDFRPDGILNFMAFFSGVVISDQMAPKIIYYAIKDDFILLSLSSVDSAAVILKIVEINRTTLKIIDTPVNKENFNFIEDIAAGVDRNEQGNQGDIIIFRRKFI